MICQIVRCFEYDYKTKNVRFSWEEALKNFFDNDDSDNQLLFKSRSQSQIDFNKIEAEDLEDSRLLFAALHVEADFCWEEIHSGTYYLSYERTYNAIVGVISLKASLRQLLDDKEEFSEIKGR